MVKNKLKQVSESLKKTSYKIRALVARKDPTMMYIILGIIILVIIAVFVYLYFTYIWTENVVIVLQDEPIDGRKGIKYVNALKLSDTRKTYSSTFCFWLNLRSMSNMQDVDTNYILSYDMKKINKIDNPYFNVIYGDVNNTNLNQITVSFKNLNNTSEHLIIKDIELQKWLCIQIVLKDTTIDFYLNGELIKSKTLNYIPIMTNKGNLIIGKKNGFNGTMTKLTYYNYDLSEFDLNKYYNRGPI
jgi:hypothetical protein